jgi:alpha-mannosidase
MSHLDIGFTAPPDEVAEQYKANLDLALRYLELFPGLVWNLEEVWQFEQWLQRTPDAEQVRKALALIEEGRLGIAAGYANMHTGLMDVAEMHHFFYPAEALRQQYGIEMATAVQNDVPGFSWALPQVLSRTGIKYLVTGPNTGTGGGGTSIPLAHNPFFWEGSDGSRVLTWISPDAYPEGMSTLRLKLKINEVWLAEALERYTSEGYPYDAILVQYAFDNRDANELGVIQLLQNVEEWNRTRANPKFILSTPEMFFEHVAARYGEDFRVYRGDWSGLWEQVKILSPAGTALVRQSKSRLYAAQGLATLNALLGGRAYPAADMDGLYRAILDYDEHSVGSIVPWPGLLTEAQINHDNALRYRQAQDVDQQSRIVLKEQWSGLSTRLQGDQPAVIVFNPLSWARTDVVSLALPEDVPCPCAVRDEETGALAPSQQLEDGRLILVAAQVPPLGYRRFLLEPASTQPQGAQRMRVWDEGIENDFFRIEVDPQSGHVTSIWDVHNERELVMMDETLPFSSLLRAKHAETYADGKVERVASGTVTVTALRGPLMGRLLIERSDTPLVRTEITMYGGLPWIAWSNVLDHSQMPRVPEKEHSALYFFALPLALEAQGMRLHVETAGGFLDPGTDLLPDANGRGFSVQHVAALEDKDGFTVVVGNEQSFLVFLENATRSGPYVPPERALLLTAAMGVAHYGSAKDVGVVPLRGGEPSAPPEHRFTYRLATQAAGFDPVQAAHLGWEAHVPLLARYVADRPGEYPATGSFLTVDQPNVAMVELKGASFGESKEVIVRLQELQGKPSTLTVHSALPIQRAWLAGATEAKLQELTPVDPLQVQLEGHAILTLRLQLDTKAPSLPR